MRYLIVGLRQATVKVVHELNLATVVRLGENTVRLGL